ncbi:MAG: N-acetyl sugar amidotransferase [Candidatus Omnitrophica bacterium]|nr:N-acetyl sugar amidotransferase [Candidatus Omnitrophota bacterium]
MVLYNSLEEYRVCKYCIMDTSDPEIIFDEEGRCSHCKRYFHIAQERILPDDELKIRLGALVEKIKNKGRGRKYDCLIGVSGGVDSTYVAYIVKKLGLRPLAVHLDNGWDSELAVKNIELTLKKLGIDLFTYVLNWEEFKDLQLSFLKASTPDLEIPTDQAIIASLFFVASRNRIKYILLGENVVTEAIMPKRWSSGQSDWKYIKNVHKKFGKFKLKRYPYFSFFKRLYYFYLKCHVINILNYIPYDKNEAIDILEKEIGWKNYTSKHYESIYTRFVQGYILPKKFGFDKRRAHLSTLICSGQMSRERALEEIAKDPYSSGDLKRQDFNYVVKKLGLTEGEFERLLSLPIKKFDDYPSYASSSFYRIIRFLELNKTIKAWVQMFLGRR